VHANDFSPGEDGNITINQNTKLQPAAGKEVSLEVNVLKNHVSVRLVTGMHDKTATYRYL
jgi:hypothetical protein